MSDESRRPASECRGRAGGRRGGGGADVGGHRGLPPARRWDRRRRLLLRVVLAGVGAAAPAMRAPVTSRNTSSSVGGGTRARAPGRPRPRRARPPPGDRRRAVETTAVSSSPCTSTLLDVRRAPRSAVQAPSASPSTCATTTSRPDRALEVVRRALRDDPAVVDDPDTVGELVGLLEVLGREEDRHPCSRLRRRTSSHTCRRLTGSRPVVGSSRNRTSRVVHEREREVQAAPHPARVGLDAVVDASARCRRARSAPPAVVRSSALERPYRRPWRSRSSTPVWPGSSDASWSATPMR